MQALVEAGADERLIKLPWVVNSLRWVLWKLVSVAYHCPTKRPQLLALPMVLDEMMKR